MLLPHSKIKIRVSWVKKHQMTARGDEGILMQTVTPPVFVLPGEGTSRAASLAFGHLVPALASAEGGKGRGNTANTRSAKKSQILVWL